MPRSLTLRGDGRSVTSRRFTRVPTPLGHLLVAVADEGVFGAFFDGQKHQPETEWFGVEIPWPAAGPAAMGDAVLRDAGTQLVAWFDGERDSFELPLAPLGTSFQRAVWEQLLRIPAGTTTTYGSISAALSDDGVAPAGQAQGVGQAVGRNPITVIVPCHRVVGSDGSLTGFAGGLERKRWLLAREESEQTRDARLF